MDARSLMLGDVNTDTFGYSTLLTQPSTPVAQDWQPLSGGSSNVSDPTASSLTRAGLALGVIGGINAAIGSFFAASSQANALKMQAQNAQFASQMSMLNARQSEFAAQSSMNAAQSAYGRYSMAQGQARSAAATALASRGIVGSVGTSAEILGSMDVIREMDKLTMNANAVRQAEAYRMQGINQTSQAVMERLTAQNLNATASSLNAPMAAFSSLMGSASEVGLSYLRSKRFEELLGGVSTKRM